jgi:cytochrome c oxidase subunit 4
VNEAGGSTGRSVVLALVALLVLTSTSWVLAHVALGHFNTYVALGIAAVKAGIVAQVFMELSHASTAARVVGGVTLLFIAILCIGVVADLRLR